MPDTREKQITYVDGLVAGFEEAQRIVRELSHGALTLNKPENINTWVARRARLRDELENEKERAREEKRKQDLTRADCMIISTEKGE